MCSLHSDWHVEESDDEKAETESHSDVDIDAPGPEEGEKAPGKVDQPALPSPAVAGAETTGSPSICGPPQSSDTVDEAPVDLDSAQQDSQPISPSQATLQAQPAPEIDYISAALAAPAQNDHHLPTHDGEAAAEATTAAENSDALAPVSTALPAQTGNVTEAAHAPSIDALAHAIAEPATAQANAADSMALDQQSTQPQPGQVSVPVTTLQVDTSSSEAAPATCEPPAISAMDVDSSATTAKASDSTGLAANAGEGLDQPDSMSVDQQPSQPQPGAVSVSPTAAVQVDTIGSEAAPAACESAAISAMDVDSLAPTAKASDPTDMATNSGEGKDNDEDSREPVEEGDAMDSDVASEPARKPVKAVKPVLAELPPGMYHRDGWSYIPMSEADALLKALDKRGVREHPLHLALQYVYGNANALTCF